MGITLIILGVLIFLIILIVWWGFVEIPANPPKFVVMTRWGKILRANGKTSTKSPGWKWFFLPGYATGFIVVEETKIVITITIKEIVAANNDTCEMEVQVIVVPERDYAEQFLGFQKEGVEKALPEIVKDRLRQWAASKIEGPADGEEMIRMKDDMVAIVLKAILGGELDHIPSRVTTPVLIKFFSSPRKPLSQIEEKEWISWDNIEQILDREFPGEKNSGWPTLKAAVQKREHAIALVRNKNGECVHKGMGIKIVGINISKVEATGAFKDGRAKLTKEMRDRAAEKIQREHSVTEVLTIKNDLGITTESAQEFFMLQQGDKITKTVEEKKLNISPESRVLIAEGIQAIADAIASKSRKGGKK